MGLFNLEPTGLFCSDSTYLGSLDNVIWSSEMSYLGSLLLVVWSPVLSGCSEIRLFGALILIWVHENSVDWGSDLLIWAL